MEKIINIDGKEIRFKANAALPLHYATHFGSDVLVDAFDTDKDAGKNTVLMYRMIWALAYCADNSISPLEKWIEEFESFPIYKIYNELSEMFWLSVRGITSKN